ncbi:MAG: right-handed parallel beta-helix repeat-containing protein, partial [Kiritimatiellales bacterium]|nr:right-handed parallel beta-helix repeat-containing protein [Kiritimatiellales bacterium]
MKRKIPMLMVLLVLNGGRILAEQSGGGSVRADCYVAVNGNDAWSGKLPEPNADKTDGPFVSLERARNAVREIKRDTPSQNITVLIREGTYCLDRTLSFGLADSAAAGCLITYAAHPGEKPVFSSDMGIGPWKKIPAGAAKRLPASAQGQVWMADLPVGLERFCTLYEGETRLPRARSAGAMPRNGKEASRTRLLFPGGFLRDWTNLDDVEIVVRPKVQFTMNILGLRSVDEKEGVATTACMASYPLTSPEEKAWALYAKTPRTLWVENVLEVLDQPGEWVADTHARKIYLWPTSNEPGGHIVAPRLRELIRVEGGIDFDGAQDSPVRGLVFRGLTFTRGDRDVWTDDDAGLQHDWALYDKGDALLRFRGAEECMVEDCRFMNSGGTAVRLDLHCRENRVSGNEIEHMGGSGILLAGYGPGTKDVSQSNLISNNHIQHSGEIFWHAPGIMVWQSGGNRIANNLIHDLPGMGIVVSGVRPVSFGKNLRECSRTIRRSEVGEVRGMADAQPFL